MGPPPYGRVGRAGEEESRWTIRDFVARGVALLLLFSLLGGLYVTLRGIEHIVVVVVMLALGGIVGVMAKRQRDAENPYRRQDAPDPEIR